MLRQRVRPWAVDARWILVGAVMLTGAVGGSCGGDGDDDTDRDPTPAAGTSTAGAGTVAPRSSAAGTTPTASAGGAAALCATERTSAEGTVRSPDLIEVSGLASSRMNEGILWAHNDSGDTARVFAMNLTGELFGTYTLAGAEAIDWEDMANGPGPESGKQYLYLGDIGDNLAQRDEIAVYRVAEPTVTTASAGESRELGGVEKLVLRYADKPHDAETLLVDPENGDLYVVTKEIAGGPASVFRAPATASASATTTMEKVAEVDFAKLPTKVQVPAGSPPLPSGLGHLPTGGDMAADGSAIAIRTYASVWIWPRTSGQSVADAFSATPCEGPSVLEPQGEAIAIRSDLSGYVTTSEGLNPPLHHFQK